MRGDPLPDTDNVTRYCPLSRLTENGRASPTAFLPKRDEPYLSVFWLEYAKLPDRSSQIGDIRRRMLESGLTLGSQAKLAVLTIGPLKTSVRTEYRRELEVKHEPAKDVDQSHSGIYGMTHGDLEIATRKLIKALEGVQAWGEWNEGVHPWTCAVAPASPFAGNRSVHALSGPWVRVLEFKTRPVRSAA